jgi:hypothetical protein
VSGSLGVGMHGGVCVCLPACTPMRVPSVRLAAAGA